MVIAFFCANKQQAAFVPAMARNGKGFPVAQAMAVPSAPMMKVESVEATSASSGVVIELQQINKMLKEGTLTEEQAAAAKNKILGI